MSEHMSGIPGAQSFMRASRRRRSSSILRMTTLSTGHELDRHDCSVVATLVFCENRFVNRACRIGDLLGVRDFDRVVEARRTRGDDPRGRARTGIGHRHRRPSVRCGRPRAETHRTNRRRRYRLVTPAEMPSRSSRLPQPERYAEAERVGALPRGRVLACTGVIKKKAGRAGGRACSWG